MNAKKRQLPALTGIRFFLALWVIVYHQSPSLLAWVGSSSRFYSAIASLTQTGYAAVGMFFILSGFVLTYNYDLSNLRSGANAKRFGIARFSRIYPAYIAGLLILLPFGAYRSLMGIDRGPGEGFGGFLLSSFLLQSWVPAAALSWNFPGWSLSNEAFFYAVLPFLRRVDRTPNGGKGNAAHRARLHLLDSGFGRPIRGYAPSCAGLFRADRESIPRDRNRNLAEPRPLQPVAAASGSLSALSSVCCIAGCRRRADCGTAAPYFICLESRCC